MTNTTNTSRAEFLEWAVTDASPLFPNEIIDPLPDGTYRTSGANAAWEAWQAARAQPVEPQIDGYPLWSGLPPPAMSDDVIREIFMRHGFTIKNGQDDLKPYVYAAARAILAVQSTDAGAVSQPLIAEAVPSQSDIAKKIRALSDSMSDIAVEMDYFGGMAEWSKHSVELLGASAVVRNWALEIDAASKKDAR
jgi:hypothetical protein